MNNKLQFLIRHVSKNLDLKSDDAFEFILENLNFSEDELNKEVEQSFSNVFKKILSAIEEEQQRLEDQELSEKEYSDSLIHQEFLKREIDRL